ncbi:hypothetical protein [Chryseobacterium sp. Marseille-Q8038]
MTKKRKVRENYQMLTNSCFIEIEGVDLEDIKKIMEKEGTPVSDEQAEEIGEFLKLLTRITIKEVFSPK